jgi:small-conductance mechanosensitive channel
MSFNLPALEEVWPRILAALPAVLLVIIGAYAAHFMLCRGLRVLSRHGSMPERDTKPIVRAGDWLIFIAALVFILNVLGFNIGGMWTMLSTVLAMIAVGFVAVWSVLSHVLCTVIMLITRPFSIGDEIEFVGEATKGRVADLNFIFTTLIAEDGGEIRVPNNLFFQKVMKRKRGGGTTTLSDQLNTPAKP